MQSGGGLSHGEHAAAHIADAHRRSLDHLLASASPGAFAWQGIALSIRFVVLTDTPSLGKAFGPVQRKLSSSSANLSGGRGYDGTVPWRTRSEAACPEDVEHRDAEPDDPDGEGRAGNASLTRIVYGAERVVDLEPGAIVNVELRLGIRRTRGPHAPRQQRGRRAERRGRARRAARPPAETMAGEWGRAIRRGGEVARRARAR